MPSVSEKSRNRTIGHFVLEHHTIKYPIPKNKKIRRKAPGLHRETVRGVEVAKSRPHVTEFQGCG